MPRSKAAAILCLAIVYQIATISSGEKGLDSKNSQEVQNAESKEFSLGDNNAGKLPLNNSEEEETVISNANEEEEEKEDFEDGQKEELPIETSPTIETTENQETGLNDIEAIKPEDISAEGPPHGYSPLEKTNFKGTGKLDGQHPQRNPIISDFEDSENKPHPSEAPNDIDEIKDNILKAKEGKLNQVSHLKKHWEPKEQALQDDLPVTKSLGSQSDNISQLQDNPLFSRPAIKPERVFVGRPPHAYNPLDKTDFNGTGKLHGQHPQHNPIISDLEDSEREYRPPHGYSPLDFGKTNVSGAGKHPKHNPVTNDNKLSENKPHPSVAPNDIEKIGKDILKAKEGKGVSYLKDLWEQKAKENQPGSVISLPELIPFISEHIKCNASGIVTISYPADMESKLSMEEQKLVKSFEMYTKNAHKLSKDVKTQHLVNGKWSMIVSKFFVRTIYRLQRGKKLQKIQKDAVKKIEDLAMETMEKNLFIKDHTEIIDYGHLPEVDLHEFAALEPYSYFRQVPTECQQKQLEVKKQDMCKLFHLMVLALSDIVVGDHSVIVCFLNEGTNTWLAETATKLQKFHTEQVLHEQLLNKSLVKDKKLLLKLINCEWASHFLHRLDDKYKTIKHKLPKNETERQKIDGLHKEILILKQNVDKYHKNLKQNSDAKAKSEISKKKFEMKEVKLEVFFPGPN